MGRPAKMLLCGEELTAQLQAWIERQANWQDTSLAEAAERLGVAPRTLQHHMKRNGLTYRRWLDVTRARRARELLAGTDTKITAIAAEIGFPSLQHFSVWFKKSVGQRPRDYRSDALVCGPCPNGNTP